MNIQKKTHTGSVISADLFHTNNPDKKRLIGASRGAQSVCKGNWRRLHAGYEEATDTDVLRAYVCVGG